MKTSKFFKLISLILAFILLALIFCSCGDKTDNSGNDNNKENNNNNNAQNPEDSPSDGIESESTTEEERLFADLPEADYDGHEYNILTIGIPGSEQWENIDLSAEAGSGDVVSDAVYRRNTAIEEKYNIIIKEDHRMYDNFFSTMQKEIKAGTGAYDLFSPRVIDSSKYMQEGYFINLLTAPNIDLTKPWYNQQGIEEMTIDDKLFIVMSDILLSDNDATAITIFNKKLLQDYGLDDPYTLVKENKWTVDKLYQMAKATSKDLNGDGKMTPADDQWGYLIWTDAMISYLHSGGQRLISKDSSGLPVVTFNTAKTYQVMDKAFILLYDENITGNVQKPEFENAGSESWSERESVFESIFTSDRAAFSWVRLYMIPRLRMMETDFGILPVPKYDESIKGYPSTVNVHHACTLGIPVTTDNLDRTTIIMEALAAESRYTVQPAYYEVSLKTKHSRDDDSAAILDLILSNRVIDVGDVYNFGGLGGDFYGLALTNDSNLASFYEKHESAVLEAINKTIENYQKLE
ncbi:MAG: hypothetical protein FWF92_06565 [Oscillospiraceae bacterium]|nr:hypothetical protein [Oscillospiraceae bacterium]